jgi:hypothetical protein
VVTFSVEMTAVVDHFGRVASDCVNSGKIFLSPRKNFLPALSAQDSRPRFC